MKNEKLVHHQDSTFWCFFHFSFFIFHFSLFTFHLFRPRQIPTIQIVNFLEAHFFQNVGCIGAPHA